MILTFYIVYIKGPTKSDLGSQTRFLELYNKIIKCELLPKKEIFSERHTLFSYEKMLK